MAGGDRYRRACPPICAGPMEATQSVASCRIRHFWRKGLLAEIRVAPCWCQGATPGRQTNRLGAGAGRPPSGRRPARLARRTGKRLQGPPRPRGESPRQSPTGFERPRRPRWSLAALRGASPRRRPGSGAGVRSTVAQGSPPAAERCPPGPRLCRGGIGTQNRWIREAGDGNHRLRRARGQDIRDGDGIAGLRQGCGREAGG